MLDDCVRNIGQSLARRAGVDSQHGESLLHIDRTTLSDDPLGLLDDDPGVQCGLQLLVDHIGLSENTLVQNANRGDIGKRLADVDIALGQ